MSNELLTAISAIKLSVIKNNFREKDERPKLTDGRTTDVK